MFTKQDIENKATEMNLEVNAHHVDELCVNHLMSDVFKQIEGNHYADAVSYAWDKAKPSISKAFTEDQVEAIQYETLEEYGDDRELSFTYSTSSVLNGLDLELEELTDEQREAIDLYVDGTEEKLTELAKQEMEEYKNLGLVLNSVIDDIHNSL